MTLTINDAAELVILRSALRLYRHNCLIEREELIEAKADDTANPEWNHNEEWLTLAITLENMIARLETVSETTPKGRDL